MMNRKSLITLSLAACLGLFSCKKDGAASNQSSQRLIVGKWTLQQQQFVQYVDGVKKVDTILNATPNSIASIQFNNDGTFNSSSAYSSGDLGNLNAGLTSP